MKSESSKKPKIIYIAETDHGDISYPSITEEIIKECDNKGLKIKVFSEFGNKGMGLGSEDEKSAVGYFSKDKINQFINERCVPMGNVFNRFDILIPEAEKSFSNDVTPSEIFEQRREYFDNPETLKLYEAEIIVRQQNQLKGIGKIGEKNSAGWNDADSKKFWGNGNAFVQKTAHQEMAQDVSKMTDGKEDVIIMVAGASHIYGLDKALGQTFKDCEKLVVGNFQEYEVDLTNLESIENAKRLSGKESCQQVGTIAGFEKSHSGQAIIPETISEVLSKSFAEKSGLSTETIAELQELKFDLKESGINIEDHSSSSEKKSFVERMRSDKTQGKSSGGSYEL